MVGAGMYKIRHITYRNDRKQQNRFSEEDKNAYGSLELCRIGSGCIIEYVHIALRERNRDALLVKANLRGSGHIPVHLPVVIDLDPGPDDKIDRRFTQRVQAHHRLRIVEDLVMGFQNVV